MSKVKLQKDSEEFKMFQDYWSLVQENWEVEETDEYWEKVVADSRTFYDKYPKNEFAHALVFAYMDELSRKGAKAGKENRRNERCNKNND